MSYLAGLDSVLWDLTAMVHTCANNVFLLSPVSSASCQNGTIRQPVASRGRGELGKRRSEGVEVVIGRLAVLS